ncbi:MAG: sulfatase-like hydrolase/transferase [Actinomycetota bacterium]|nr:sulfatase-like hydrolase/transferase [Actinomycetota bacterium]
MTNKRILFITLDQWRGDCFSAAGHPIVKTPSIDRIAKRGVIFKNHFANAAPCGPSRACLYTGTYLHKNRSVANGTPLSDEFTNFAKIARGKDYEPVLFGYTDTSVDPTNLSKNDSRLFSYEGVLPGLDPVVHDPFEAGSLEWGKWLASQGIDVPSFPRDLYQPDPTFKSTKARPDTFAPTQFRLEQSESAFLVEKIIEYISRRDREDFFIHASFIRPHPPRRNPVGFHDFVDMNDVDPFLGAISKEEEAKVHPLTELALGVDFLTPKDEADRLQKRATYYGSIAEVDLHIGTLLDFLEREGILEETYIILTADHGDQNGDHHLFEKLGFYDESFHIPLIIAGPEIQKGVQFDEFTEAVDVLPTICEIIEEAIPKQCDGNSLLPYLEGEQFPSWWRPSAHFEWDFRSFRRRLGGPLLDIPPSYFTLTVLRGSTFKLVTFSAPQDFLPPLLFNVHEDPDQIHNLITEDEKFKSIAGEMALDLMSWRMRTDDRRHANQLLTHESGLIEEEVYANP